VKEYLTSLALILAIAVARAAGQSVDLTGADASKFRSHLGQTVSLRGRLEQGMQGPSLFGATPTNVAFYVIPEMPASGGYSYPTTWTRLMHKQVRLTGELKFRSFDRNKAGPFDQIPPDYYYMVLQRTKIERVESNASLAQTNEPAKSVYAEAEIRRTNSVATISIFITNPTGERFEFFTGAAGGPGEIVGPDFEQGKGSWAPLGTPPNVLPSLVFSNESEEVTVMAKGIGGLTRRRMDPSIFALNPSERKLYCQFEIAADKTKGRFISGHLRRHKEHVSHPPGDVDIPILKGGLNR